jgi:hypothetical protein
MKARRKSTGGQIAELAPALLILFIVVLFPMVDIMYLGIGYCAGWYLNQMTARACSTVKTAEYPAAEANMKAAWESSGLALFTRAGVVKNKATAINYGSTLDRETGNPMQLIQVETEVAITPFLSLAGVPFMAAMNIDGLTRPIVFRYLDKRPLEETNVN